MPPQFEDENASVFSETDLVNAETISVISSSVAADFSDFLNLTCPIFQKIYLL